MSRSTRLASAGLVAAAILAIAACGSSTGSGAVAGATGTPGISPALPSASAAASAEASASGAPSGSGGFDQAFLTFQATGGSTFSGGAILTDLGDGTTVVTIGLVAPGVTEPMPASLVTGTCSSPGSPAPAPSAAASSAASEAPSAAASPAASVLATLTPNTPVRLGDLTAGTSNTIVQSTLDNLLAGPYAIAVYKSAADSTMVACADVKR